MGKDVKSSPYALNPNAPCFTMNADGTFQMIPHTNQRRMSNKPDYYASEGPQDSGKGFGSWCRQRMAEPKRVSKAIPIVAPTDLEAGMEGSSSGPAVVGEGY